MRVGATLSFSRPHLPPSSAGHLHRRVPPDGGAELPAGVRAPRAVLPTEAQASLQNAAEACSCLLPWPDGAPCTPGPARAPPRPARPVSSPNARTRAHTCTHTRCTRARCTRTLRPVPPSPWHWLLPRTLARASCRHLRPACPRALLRAQVCCPAPRVGWKFQGVDGPEAAPAMTDRKWRMETGAESLRRCAPRSPRKLPRGPRPQQTLLFNAPGAGLVLSCLASLLPYLCAPGPPPEASARRACFCRKPASATRTHGPTCSSVPAGRLQPLAVPVHVASAPPPANDCASGETRLQGHLCLSPDPGDRRCFRYVPLPTLKNMSCLQGNPRLRDGPAGTWPPG